MVSDIMKESKKLQSGAQAQKKSKDQVAAGAQQRRFYRDYEVENHIGRVIAEAKIADFGPLLAGQDYDDDNPGYILRGDFFQTIMSIPEFTEGKDGLKRGDVLDLMNKYDEGRTGRIKL